MSRPSCQDRKDEYQNNSPVHRLQGTELSKSEGMIINPFDELDGILDSLGELQI